MTKFFLKTLIILLLCSVAHPLLALENYKAGYIINQLGDTTNGFIDYQQWNSNPQSIKFKVSLDQEHQILSHEEIQGFGVANQHYKSALVDIEMSLTNVSNIDNDPTLAIKTEFTFLQAVVLGTKSLWINTSTNDKVNFYFQNGETFELLIYKKHILDGNGQPTIKENNKYLGQLTFFLQDCSSINELIQSTSYDIHSLQTLFVAYYNCIDSKYSFNKRLEKGGFEISIISGMTFSSLNFASANFDQLVNADFDKSKDLTIGLAFDYVFPKNFGRWSWNSELVYTSYFFKDYQEKPNSSTYIEVGYSYAKLNSMIRFKVPVSSVQLFANLGLSAGIAFNETNYMKETKFSRIIEGVALKDTRSIEKGILIGLGAKYKRFSIEARHEWSDGMSDYQNLVSKVGRLYLLLGYKF